MGETPSNTFPTRLYIFLAMTSSEISIFINESRSQSLPGLLLVLPPIPRGHIQVRIHHSKAVIANP